MTELKTLELFSLEAVSNAARLDSSSMTTEPASKYVEENALSYYVLINTWLLSIREYCPYGWARFADRIAREGLIKTIAFCASEADTLVHGDELHPFVEGLMREINRSLAHGPRSAVSSDLNIGRDPMATALFVLRYPKRFSPSLNDKVKEATIRDFLQYENRTKQLQARGYSQFVLQEVRDTIAEMYDWEAIVAHIQSLEEGDIIFSSGSCFDADSRTVSKLRAILNGNHAESYFGTQFGVRQVPLKAYTEEPRYNEVKVLAVPKSYKASRIIAMEDTYRQGKSKRVEMIFRDYDRKMGKNAPINLEDQGINQALACEGSRTGSLATLDASHASDLISRSFFCEVFPSEYVDIILPLLGNRLDIGGRKYVQQMNSTSGHSLTFRHETIVYKAIGLAASKMNCRFRGEPEDNAFCWAYGDDTVVRSVDVELVIQFFTACGLKINEDKSFFGSHPYRESCGMEYYNGLVMTSVYYPRFPVVGRIKGSKISLSNDCYKDEYRGKLNNSATMLIDLQKKLFRVSYGASRFVYAVVKSALPQMTTSVEGAVCSDLWEYDDAGVTRYPKMAHVEVLPAYYAEKKVKLFGGKEHVFRTYHKAGEWKMVNEKFTDAALPQVVREAVDRAVEVETYHLTPKTVFKWNGKIDELTLKIYEIYKYKSFLKYGPQFDSPLDELLGVSSRPMTLAQFMGKMSLDWSYTVNS
jgi:hypothetical protein